MYVTQATLIIRQAYVEIERELKNFRKYSYSNGKGTTQGERSFIAKQAYGK